VRIASARAADLRAIATLMAASPLLRRYGVTADSARAGLREGVRARDTVLVARDGKDVVGLAWIIAMRALDRSAYLRLLLVAESRQSRGMGAALLAEAERRARAAGARHMVLLVTKTNRRARSFYARLGYRYVGVLPAFARPRIAEALYVKTWPRSGRSANRRRP
jgi:ribosomal protein S18 acetylase RimI-like enzyme